MLRLNAHSDSASTIDILPCEIKEFEGSTEVDQYFIIETETDTTSEEKEESLVASLRGRKLVGKQRQAKGSVFVLRRNEEDDQFESVMGAQNIRVWGHDSALRIEEDPIEHINELIDVNRIVRGFFCYSIVSVFFFVFECLCCLNV